MKLKEEKSVFGGILDALPIQKIPTKLPGLTCIDSS